MDSEREPEQRAPMPVAALIGAAVQAYLDEEQRSLALAAGSSGVEKIAAPSPWGLSGRLAIMQGRALMQRRVWK